MARRAHALATLLRQVDAHWPDRPTASDGWIGDTKHQSRRSDHNPNAAGVVRAIDITGDVGHDVVERIRLARDKRVTYIISRRRICSSYDHRDGAPWTWRPYSGSNPHDKHAHVSVSRDPDLYDDASPWALALGEVAVATAGIAAATAVEPPGEGDTEEVAELLDFVRRLRDGLESLQPPSNAGALALAAEHLRDIRGEGRPVTVTDVRRIVTDELASEVDRIVDLVIERVTERMIVLDEEDDRPLLPGLEAMIDSVAHRVRELVDPDEWRGAAEA